MVDVKKEIIEENSANRNAPGRRKTFIVRSSDRTIKPETGLLDLTILTTVVDRYAGTTVTHEIWREEPNIQVIMEQAKLPDVRNECAEFFLTRQIVKLIGKILPVKTVQIGDVLIQPEKLFNAISSAVPSSASAVIIMEIVNSYLRRLGMMSNNGEFCTEYYYPVSRVTVSKLSKDIAMQEVMRVMSECTQRKVFTEKVKYTAEAFGATLAQVLTDVGKAFLDINQLSSLMDDVIKGIRAYICNGRHEFHTGLVPADWREDAIIQELSKNYVFLHAALDLPIGSDLTPVNDSFRRFKWAPVILAAFKTSLRYKTVDAAELTRYLSKQTIKDLKDRPCVYVMNSNASVEPVGQAVYAFNDATLSSAITIIPLKERIDQAIAAAYPKDDSMGLDSIVERYVNFMTDAIENGYVPDELGYSFNIGSYDEPFEHELVCILSDRVQVEDSKHGIILPGQEDGSNPNPASWWYEVECTHKLFAPLLSGRVLGNRFITNNVGEALLAMKDFKAKMPMEKKPQMINPKAFNTRLLEFDQANVLIPATERFAYSVVVGNSTVSGSFKTHDLGSMKSAAGTMVVKPRYNEEVFIAIASVFNEMSVQLTKIRKQTDPVVPESVSFFIERRIPTALLATAKKVSEGFRNEVHYGIMRRATKGMPSDEAMNLSARLAQAQFGAYADAVAFALFLAIQGIDIDFIQEIMKSSVFTKQLMEVGTDRPAML